MTIRIAINGMGRIGRCYLRYRLDQADLDVVAVNDISDVRTIAALLRYDSTFGPLGRQVDVEKVRSSSTEAASARRRRMRLFVALGEVTAAGRPGRPGQRPRKQAVGGETCHQPCPGVLGNCGNRRSSSHSPDRGDPAAGPAGRNVLSRQGPTSRPGPVTCRRSHAVKKQRRCVG